MFVVGIRGSKPPATNDTTAWLARAEQCLGQQESSWRSTWAEHKRWRWTTETLPR